MTTSIARQMLSAEILKLRRNRGVMALAFVLTVGVVVLLFGYTAVEHATDPTSNPPAGGLYGFDHGVRSLAVFFGMLASVLIGTEAGTADLSSGVFRDLVVTGRSRLALFGVRMPAGAIVALGLSGTAYALVLVGTFAFAGSQPTPDLGLILESAGWIALANVVVVGLAVGVGSLTGSRAVTLTAVIGWQVILTNLLVDVSSLGSARDLLLTPALTQVMPLPAGHDPVIMADAVAIAVLLGWLLIPQAVGGWRTRTRDA
jgi:hypothetical protein